MNLVELLGKSEKTCLLYLWGMNPLAYLAYSSSLSLLSVLMLWCTTEEKLRFLGNVDYHLHGIARHQTFNAK